MLRIAPALMRIFMNMGLVEHTGHEIPTITGKYGTEVFDVTDQYIRCVEKGYAAVCGQTESHGCGVEKSGDNRCS